MLMSCVKRALNVSFILQCFSRFRVPNLTDKMDKWNKYDGVKYTAIVYDLDFDQFRPNKRAFL